jgi:hypothetical protein
MVLWGLIVVYGGSKTGLLHRATHAQEDGSSGMLDSAAHGGGAQSIGSGDGEHEEEEIAWLRLAAVDKARWWMAQAGSVVQVDAGRAGGGLSADTTGMR